MLCIAVEMEQRKKEYFDRVISLPAYGPGHTLTAFHTSDTHTRRRIKTRAYMQTNMHLRVRDEKQRQKAT